MASRGQKLALVAGGAVAGVLFHNFMRYLSAEVLARWLADKSRRAELIPIVDDQSLWGELVRLGCPPSGLFAFYSSASGAITTRQELMHVPIDDHAIVRGHAVFDTAALVGRKIYRLDVHLARLLKSARAARIPLPFGEDDESNARTMARIVRATCQAARRADADVRFWLTAGTGNLGVTPKGCTPGFYVLIFGGLPTFDISGGVPEVTVAESRVAMKPPMLAEIKSNNYLLNALLQAKLALSRTPTPTRNPTPALTPSRTPTQPTNSLLHAPWQMDAQDRGGTFGIGIDAAGNVRESCVLNVVVVTKV